MRRRSIAPIVFGALAGAVAGMFLLAAAAHFLIEGAAGALVLSQTTQQAQARFVADATATYWLVLLCGSFLGAVTAAVTRGLASLASPDETRVSTAPLLVLGAALGAAAAYATVRAGLGLTAEIGPDATTGFTVITVSVARAIGVALTAGAVTGGVIAAATAWLSRPAALGLEGPAWPRTAARFVREATPAMVIPILAIVTLFAVVFLFSRLLLLEPGAIAVTIFSVGAAVVLGGAAFVAAHPRRSSRKGGPE